MTDPVKDLLQSRKSMLADLGSFVERESPSDDKGRTNQFGGFLAGFLGANLDARLNRIDQPDTATTYGWSSVREMR